MNLTRLTTLAPIFVLLAFITACGGSGGSKVSGTISASDSSIPANGVSTTTLTVQATKKGKNLTEGGETVVLTTSSGTLSTVTNNGDGTYTATLTSSKEITTAGIEGKIKKNSFITTVDFIAAALINQTASISVNTATGALTVNTQPDDFVFTGSASLNTGTLTVTLEMDSNFTQRVLFNPKAWISNISDGAFDNSTTMSHTFEAMDYVYYGPEAMEATVASTSRDFDITGVTAGTVTFDVEITDSPMLLTRDQYSNGHVLTDSATGVTWGQIDCTPISYRTLDSTTTPQASASRTACGARRLIFSEDGTMIYSTNKTHPTVSAIDTTTLTYPILSNISSGADNDTVGSVLDFAFNSDRSKFYALLNLGGHGTPEQSYDSGTGKPADFAIELVELNSALGVTNRVTIATQIGNDNIRAKGIAISPDGSTAAIIVDHEDAESGIYFVDLNTMTVIDTDSVTAGTQAVAHGADTFLPKSIIYVDDTTVVVSYGGYTAGTFTSDAASGDKLVFINTADYTTTEMTSAITNDLGQVQPGDLQLGPDGNIYWTRACFRNPMKDAAAYLGTEALSIVNPTTKAETLVQLGEDADNTDPNACGYGVGLAFSQDGSTLYVANDWYGNGDAVPSIDKFNVSTTTRLDFDGDTTNGITGNSDMTQKFTPLGNQYATSHSMAISPF